MTIRASPADAGAYERAASLRDQERELLAEQESHHQEWAATHPDLPALAEKVRQLSEEIDRLRDLLRQHGAEPEEGTA
jgi:chromosome segregation ATPase